jgi:hypothetical protein
MERSKDMDPNEEIGTEEKAFQTFKKDGIRYIAIPYDQGIKVIDENGINYGGFMNIENFNKYYSDDKVVALGKAELKLIHTETFTF